MVSNLLDEYVLNVLKNSGWSDGRKQDITQWIQILTEEGLVLCQDLVQVKMRNFSPF